jgi:large subunit ribosomal protein L24
MKTKQKMHVKVGDIVTIISGSEKNKIGEVIKLNYNSGKIIIKGINFKVRHIKPIKENDIGEIKQIAAPIHHSNVKLKINES